MNITSEGSVDSTRNLNLSDIDIGIDGAAIDDRQRYNALKRALDAAFCIVLMKFDESGLALDYQFLEVNDVFTAHTGIVDAPGRWMRTIAPDHERYWFEIYGRVASTGEPTKFENRAGALGSKWFEVHAFPVGATDSNQVGIIFTDVTRQKKLEEELYEVRAELDAVARSSFVDTVTGSIAHELTQPLAAIQSFAEAGSRWLSHNPSNVEEAKSSLSRLISSVTYARGVITQIRELVGASKNFTSAPVDMADLLNNARAVLSHAVIKHRASLVIEAPKYKVFANGEKILLTQAVVNLVTNALEATTAAVTADPIVRIALKLEGVNVVVTVSDNGPGWKDSEISRALNAFYSTKASGMGLGLAIVKKTIDAHGGSLDLRNMGCGGAVAEFRVPAYMAAL